MENKRTKWKFYNLKLSALIEIKTLLEGLHNILKMAEEREVEDQSIKIIQPGREKKD